MSQCAFCNSFKSLSRATNSRALPHPWSLAPQACSCPCTGFIHHCIRSFFRQLQPSCYQSLYLAPLQRRSPMAAAQHVVSLAAVNVMDLTAFLASFGDIAGNIRTPAARSHSLTCVAPQKRASGLQSARTRHCLLQTRYVPRCSRGCMHSGFTHSCRTLA
jgi:hypothetical protein